MTKSYKVCKKNVDKAGEKYWSDNWSKSNFPLPFDHLNLSLDNYVNQELHKYFQKILNHEKKISILEIGCANSVWPLYFKTYFDADVYGLDYSEIGCQNMRTMLKDRNVSAEIYNIDLFQPPEDLMGKFDFVVSFGVVEHFLDTGNCLNACAKFVKDGGKLFTLIPNLSGIMGTIQKCVNKSIYDIHVPLTKDDLHNAHNDADLKLIECEYFLSINLNVINIGENFSSPFKKILRHMFSSISKVCWILERIGIKLPRCRFTSPYIIALATKI